MNRAQLEAEARRRLETLSPSLQELALLRATGRPIIAWDHMTRAQVERIMGSAVAVAMIFEVLS